VVLGALHRSIDRSPRGSVAPAIVAAVGLLALTGTTVVANLSLVVLLMGALVAGLVAWHVAALQRPPRNTAPRDPAAHGTLVG
jgi:hypothetical protein